MAELMVTGGGRQVTGNCLFCLKDLTTRPEVRELRCKHLSCSECLRTELGKKAKLKCPQCKCVTEREFNNLAVVYTYQIYKCQSRNCENEAVVWCSSCPKFYCEEHEQSHSDTHYEHTTDVVSIIDYRRHQQELELEINNRKCSIHRVDIVAVCKVCFKLLCDDCLGEDSSSETCAHQISSIKRSSEQAFKRIEEETGKLREVDEKLEKLLKFAQLQKEATSSANNQQIKKLKEALQRWQVKLNEITNTLEEKVNRSTADFEFETRRFEQQINDRLKTNQKKEDAVCILSEQHPITILKKYKTHEMELKELQSTFILPLPQPQLLLLDNLHVKIPWMLKRLVPPFYKSSEFKEKINTEKKSCYTVDHLDDGTVVHGGSYGIKTTRKTITDDSTHGMFITEPTEDGSQSIYLLHSSSTEEIVTEFDIHGNCTELIRYPKTGTTYGTHLAVSKDYIVIANQSTGSLKVFLKINYEHKFDIKLEQISEEPWGVEILPNNTLVVTDWQLNAVINITIEENPIIIWQLSAHFPAGIHFDKTTGCILVVCFNGNEIYVISVEGMYVDIVLKDMICTLIYKKYIIRTCMSAACINS